MKYLIAIIVLLTFNQVVAKNKIYKWTDGDGNIHYTENKPSNQKTDEIKIRKSKPIPAEKSTNDKAEKTDKPNKKEKENPKLTAEQIAANEYNQAEQERVRKIEDQENCKIAKQNKITLEKSFGVKKKNPATGEYIKMDKTEIKKQLTETRKQIRELCK